VAWPQTQRRAPAQLTARYYCHCRRSEPDGPTVSHHAAVYASDRSGSATPIDQPKRLHRRAIAHRRDDCDETQRAGLLSANRGQEPAPKKLPETDAIFAQVKQRNEEADEASDVLRISIDAKAVIKVGPFARGGKSRIPTKAADHDFEPVATVTPVGIFLPAFDELFLYGVTSKVTSRLPCGSLDRLVGKAQRARFTHQEAPAQLGQWSG